MKKLKWFILIIIIVLGVLYYKVSDSEITVSTACFSNEIHKMQKGGNYYLNILTTKERIRCTKSEYDKIKGGEEKLLYGIMYKKNSFLSKYFNYEPKLEWFDVKNTE